MTEHETRIFSEGSYERGTLTWGWECACGVEQLNYGSATGARTSADEHEATA